MKLLKSLLLVAITMVACQGIKRESINLIPVPAKVEVKGGEYIFSDASSVSIPENSLETSQIARDFVANLNRRSGMSIAVTTGGEGDILFAISDDYEKYGEEGYLLEVAEAGINITAAKPAGLFYATQSIYQLLPDSYFNESATGVDLSITAIEIFDKPRFEWRGNMLDPSRHFIEVDFIKQNLDYLASLKMNRFHWHLTDDQGWRIEIKSLPDLTGVGAWRVDRNDEVWWGRKPQQPGEETTYGGYYTQEQIREIVDYADQRYITIIPEKDMPGHSQSAIASYPEISCDGGPYFVATGGVAKDNTYCPGKEVTFEFIEKVLSEVIDLFPSEYIHIGGDECNKEAWMVCDDCQERIRKEGLADEHELQSYFIARVEKFINSKGRKMIGWDEILEGGLAPNATVMSWRGEAGGIEAIKAGHDVVMSPNSYCYLDLKQGDPAIEPDLGYGQLLLSTVYSYNPVPEGFSQEEENHILGIQGNLWGESMQNPEQLNYMLFPRMFALAEVAWSPQPERDFNEFIPRMEKALERLSLRGINYARSAYNVSIGVLSNPASGEFMIGLSTEVDNVEIRYSLDGTDPGVDSEIYSKPFPITETTTIKAISVKESTVLGELSEKTLTLHKAAGKRVTLEKEPSDKYNPGAQALTDCLKGSSELFNTNWIGYLGDNFEATVDLGEETQISKISVSFLQSTGSWIFLPLEIEFLVSLDGELYDTVKVVENSNQGNQMIKEIRDYFVTVDKTVRYIKVKALNYGELPDWHPGAGSKSWLFVDEIEVI